MSEKLINLNYPWIQINLLNRKPNWVVKSTMNKIEFAKFCCRRDGITIDQIMAGKLDDYVAKGLQVLTMCNDGSGRSLNVETSLNHVGIPSIRLAGGLKQFLDPSKSDKFVLVSSSINRVPNVAVILTLEERNLFNFQLQNLRAFRYLNSASAIKSIIRMLQV